MVILVDERNRQHGGWKTRMYTTTTRRPPKTLDDTTCCSPPLLTTTRHIGLTRAIRRRFSPSPSIISSLHHRKMPRKYFNNVANNYYF